MKEVLFGIDHLHQDHLRHEQSIDELDHVLHRKMDIFLLIIKVEKWIQKKKMKIPALCDEASHVCTRAISSVPKI